MSILHVSDLPTFHTHDAATALQRVCGCLYASCIMVITSYDADAIYQAQAVTVHAYDTTFIGAPHEEGKEATRVGLATRAEGGGGGVNIGAIIGEYST